MKDGALESISSENLSSKPWWWDPTDAPTEKRSACWSAIMYFMEIGFILPTLDHLDHGGLESQEAICKGKAIPSYDEIPVAFQPTRLYQMLQSPQMVVLSRREQLLDSSTAFL